MANLKASKKDIVKSKKNRQENIPFLSRARNEVKKFLALLSKNETKLEDAQTQLSRVNSACSKASKKGVYHANKTSRIVSRLTHRMKKHFNQYAS